MNLSVFETLKGSVGDCQRAVIQEAKLELGIFYGDWCASLREHSQYVRFYTPEACYYMHESKRVVFEEGGGPVHLVVNQDYFESRWELYLFFRFSFPEGAIEKRLQEDDEFRRHHISQRSSEATQLVTKKTGKEDNLDLGVDTRLRKLSREIVAMIYADLSLEIEETDRIPDAARNPGKNPSTPNRYSRPRSTSEKDREKEDVEEKEGEEEEKEAPSANTLDEETKQAMDSKRYRLVKKIKFKKAMPSHNLLAKDKWNAADPDPDRDRDREDNEGKGHSDDSDDSGFEDSEVEIRGSITTVGFVGVGDLLNRQSEGEILAQMSGKSDASSESDRGSFTLGVNPLHGRARALSRHRQKLMESNRHHESKDDEATL